jgi:hypothetical protein
MRSIYDSLDEGVVVEEGIRHAHDDGRVVGHDAADLGANRNEQPGQEVEGQRCRQRQVRTRQHSDTRRDNHSRRFTLSTVSDMVLVSTTRCTAEGRDRNVHLRVRVSAWRAYDEAETRRTLRCRWTRLHECEK